MANKNSLFYSVKDFKKIVLTLKKISGYILCDFAIVGGVANRALFSDWAKKIKHSRFNDIDLVLLPDKNLKARNLIDLKIKNDFFATHISPQYDGFYFALTDKENFAGVDIFVRPRDLDTQPVYIDKIQYLALSNEEIYLGTLRNIYETLIRDRELPPKHIKFRDYLETKIDTQKLIDLWPKEKKIIRFQTREYLFDTFEAYLNKIEKLIIDKQNLIKVKIISSPKSYPKDCVGAYGITIEDKTTFDDAMERKRKAMGWYDGLELD